LLALTKHKKISSPYYWTRSTSPCVGSVISLAHMGVLGGQFAPLREWWYQFDIFPRANRPIDFEFVFLCVVDEYSGKYGRIVRADLKDWCAKVPQDGVSHTPNYPPLLPSTLRVLGLFQDGNTQYLLWQLQFYRKRATMLSFTAPKCVDQVSSWSLFRNFASKKRLRKGRAPACHRLLYVLAGTLSEKIARTDKAPSRSWLHIRYASF
jgi:hypothetical protein